MFSAKIQFMNDGKPYGDVIDIEMPVNKTGYFFQSAQHNGEVVAKEGGYRGGAVTSYFINSIGHLTAKGLAHYKGEDKNGETTTKSTTSSAIAELTNQVAALAKQNADLLAILTAKATPKTPKSPKTPVAPVTPVVAAK